MRPTPILQPRQFWELNTQTTSRTTASPQCSPLTLPANGALSFAPDNVVTLTADIIFQPDCDSVNDANSTGNDTSAVNDPFYASSTPQVYVLSAATVLGWVLVVMLIISPRTFFAGGSGSGSTFGGRGVIGGANGGSTSLIGVGSRPWLQKAAALTVAIALSIATADTFKVSEAHYPVGIDGNSLREVVENSYEIKITRAISDIFVWLAQVQTLIRLFPRHKEKVLIKWIGFALIILDTTFSCLNSFLSHGYRRPRDFVDAIPALSYLFELALGLLYAAWVIFYSITKRRYAFYHPKMKNICVLALLSLVSILTPVVFFVTDVTLPDVAGWGDYFRWVGAAAASVVVWEWVERIEALERDEKKDGILGREIFDGDEMLDINPSSDMTYVPRRNDRYVPRGWHERHSNGSTTGSGSDRPSFAALAKRFPRTSRKARKAPAAQKTDGSSPVELRVVPGVQTEPKSSSRSSMASASPPGAHIVQPPSRTDTTSAASTVYVVRHDGGAETPGPSRRRNDTTPEPLAATLENEQGREVVESGTADDEVPASRSTTLWHTAMNPFKRKRTNTPAEVRAAQRASVEGPRPPPKSKTINSGPANLRFGSRWQLKNAFGPLAGGRREGINNRQTGPRTSVELPWTIVPAPTRGATTWSPGVPNDPDQAAGATHAGEGTPPRVDLGSEDRGHDV